MFENNYYSNNILIILINNVYASDLINLYGKDKSTELVDATNKIQTGMNRTIYISQLITVAVAVIMLMVLGIKYVTASPGEKADVKKNSIIYVVGAIVAFGGYVILGWIQDFAVNLK